MILGNSEFGKSTLLKVLHRRALIPSGQPVAVYDILAPDADEDPEAYAEYVGENWPGAVYVTNDRELFLKMFWESYGYVWIIDEGGEAVGKTKDDMRWIATRGSHHRQNSIYMVAHRWTDIDTTIRAQFTEIFLFNAAKSDALDMADQFGAPALKDAVNLSVGEFYHRLPGQPVGKWAIDPEKMSITKA